MRAQPAQRARLEAGESVVHRMRARSARGLASRPASLLYTECGPDRLGGLPRGYWLGSGEPAMTKNHAAIASAANRTETRITASSTDMPWGDSRSSLRLFRQAGR